MRAPAGLIHHTYQQPRCLPELKSGVHQGYHADHPLGETFAALEANRPWFRIGRLDDAG